MESEIEQEPATKNTLNETLRKHGFLLFILLLSLVGMALVAYGTVWGPGITSDSVYYILSADNLVKGYGFGLPWGSGRFLPYAGDPPFYPLTVAGMWLLGMDIVAAARWVGILAFGVTIFASGWLGYRASGSKGLGACLSVLALTSAMLLELFTRAMSETVYFACSVSGGLWLLAYLKERRRSDLWLAAVMVSAAFLARYTGAALALAAGLSLLAFGGISWRRRLADAAIVTAVVSLPMIGWLAWGYTQTGQFGERVLNPALSLGGSLAAFRLKAAEIVWSWIPLVNPTGYNTQKVVFGVGLLAAAGLWLWMAWRSYCQGESRLGHTPLLRWVAFFGLYAILFVLVYLAGFTFTLPTPDLNERLFSPLYQAAIFTLFGLLFMTARTWRRQRWLGLIPVALLAVIAAGSLPSAWQLLAARHADGLGYTGRLWQQSQTIAALKELPANTPIITNEVDAVLFLTGRPAVWLPDVIGTQPVEVFTRFGDSPQQLPEEKSFKERKGALALFPSITRQLENLYGERAGERLEALTYGLVVYARFGPVEAIYFYDEDSLP